MSGFFKKIPFKDTRKEVVLFFFPRAITWIVNNLLLTCLCVQKLYLSAGFHV